MRELYTDKRSSENSGNTWLVPADTEKPAY